MYSILGVGHVISDVGLWSAEVTAGECLVFLAEVAVAVVIYFELAHQRESSFLGKATEKNANEQRRKIYEKYLELAGTDKSTSLEEKSDKFVKELFGDKDLRQCCDQQISLFNELGFVYRGRFIVFESGLVEILPHAAIYIFIILKPYLLQRRADAGEWFAQPLIRFTRRSVGYVLAYDHELCLKPNNESEGLTISVQELEALKAELDAISKLSWRTRLKLLRLGLY
jgi:hypothetical protein